MLTPAFHFNILESFLVSMNEQSNVMVRKVAEKIDASAEGAAELDVVGIFTACALDIICGKIVGPGTFFGEGGVGALLVCSSIYLIHVSMFTQKTLAQRRRWAHRSIRRTIPTVIMSRLFTRKFIPCHPCLPLIIVSLSRSPFSLPLFLPSPQSWSQCHQTPASPVAVE